MKKILLTAAFMVISAVSFGQFTTGIVILTTNRAIKIDTDATTATMTITGPSNVWLGVGFNGFSMTEVTDMFIWNATTNRDYIAPGGHNLPAADTSQSWTITGDSVSSGIRTVVATRPLVSAGDYTFVNDASSINIIYAEGTSTTLANHGTAPHATATLPRTAILKTEDFSLNATAIYPNPSNGVFSIQTKTNLDTITIYSQIGAFVKKIKNTAGTNNLEVNLKDLQSGVYLLELQNESEKSWKKIVIE